MITRRLAEGLSYRQELYHISNRNADGTPQRWRVNGKVKLWKTRPDDFRVPVKFGLDQHDYLTQDNADQLCVGMIEVICSVCKKHLKWKDSINIKGCTKISHSFCKEHAAAAGKEIDNGSSDS